MLRSLVGSEMCIRDSYGVFLLESHAATLLLLLPVARVGIAALASSSGISSSLSSAQNAADRLLKNALESLLGERRALQVHLGANGLRELVTVLFRGQLLLLELVESLLVLAQINLGADEHQLGLGAVVRHLRVPLGSNVLERGGRNHGKAQQEHVRLGIAEGAQARVLLLAGRIPQGKVDQLAVHLHTVVKLSNTVGTYSTGKRFSVYEMSREVFPTAPSPTTTHLTFCIAIRWSSGGEASEEGEKN
eukprot:TRINITY_DN452_c0_g1_i1.p1 TRINITY_DN452_c0_g1~~TRINITY_DN452_c0_g1_i1.p1  ORF type:complete len:248 (+),score=-53.40 TRINITY_DN452_c0_g1_i1:2-745(+)